VSAAKPPHPGAKKKPPAKRRSLSPPDVKLSYQAAGRDTLATIDAERTHAVPSRAEAPAIEISESPIGRETMAAITRELTDIARPRQDTLPYEDQIKNAPGARSPSRAPAPPLEAAAPLPAEDPPDEVTIKLQTKGLKPRPAPQKLEIFELLTFIVRGSDVGDLSTDTQRRKFVQEHLPSRLPSGSVDSVERIEVTPWTTQGTMVLRVWCRA